MGMTHKILKQFMFSEEICRKAEHMAKALGFSVPEYVRYLIVKDSVDNGFVEVLDEQTSKEVEEAEEEYKRGEFTVYHPKKLLSNFLMDKENAYTRVSGLRKEGRKVNKGKLSSKK